MRRPEAHRLLSALPAARDAWPNRTVAELPADALWLAGSLGRGEGDQWSDVDLIVVGGELPLHDALLTLEVPQNGPAVARTPRSHRGNAALIVSLRRRPGQILGISTLVTALASSRFSSSLSPRL